MSMLPRHLATLELDKILALLAAETTFSASRELAERLVPSSDAADIRRAQDATEEARRLLEIRPNTGVRGARDVTAHTRRAAVGGLLQPADLLEIGTTLAAGRSIKNLLVRQEIQTPVLARVARDIPDLAELEDAIGKTLDDEGRVLDGASERLRGIRLELRSAYDRLVRRLNELIARSSIHEALQEPIITMRSGRYVLPVKADFRGRVRGIVHDQSGSGATLFVEPLETVELTNRWRQHGIEEEREIERILLELSGRVGANQYGVLDTVQALARIDLAFAMGKLSVQMEAIRPTLHLLDGKGSTGAVHLVDARHPLLRGEVVPLTIELGLGFDVLLITGPNTGGKTVALKTVGLLALMAQSGLQIPAAEGSSLAIFSGIYADIGDEQSIAQNLSTFSSHITRIVEILQNADSGALALLDEIGAGTDPQEGSALSQAVLEHLVASRIYTIATSHYSELKSFAYATPGVENASVEFDPETLRPTYRLTIGLPGRSNALAIAERLGMPSDIVARAREHIHPSQQRAEELLADIHEHLARAQEERAQAAMLRRDADRRDQQLRTRLTEVEHERREVLTRAEEEGAAVLSDLQREAGALRRELRGLRTERERVAAIEERIDSLRGETRTSPAQGKPGAQRDAEPIFLVGDYVYVPSLGTNGVVRALPVRGSAEIEIEGKRVRVPAGDLERAEVVPTPRERAVAAGQLIPSVLPRRVSAEGWSPIESQLDLRGYTTEDARQRLDQYLNDAYMEGLQTVRVVHGKGTGAVRQAVRELLADHPLVRSHETAEQREGGEGATVVTLAS
jgi:DNA mismatch repair protein MutS2